MSPVVEPVGKIVVSLSGPLVNPRVIHEAVRFSRLMNSKLHAIHMSLPKAGELTMMMDPLRKYSEADLRDHFRLRGYPELAETIPLKIVKGRNVAKMLKDVTNGADLLIIGHKHRNRLTAALATGSIALQILDVVSCPVMVIPKTAE